jgi:FtsH-binding integral membrane protein
MLGSFHGVWGWVTVGLDLVAGMYGVGLAIGKRAPGRLFRVAIGAAIGASVLQVTVGVILYGSGERPGRFHVFYGVLTALALAFAYVYRDEMNKRHAALRWGLFGLLLMGLGLRAITTFAG